MEPYVLSTDNGDGSAEFTISFAEDDHRFSASIDGDTALIQYDETLSYRGKIRVSEPDEDVFEMLVKSDEMTEFLDEHDLEGVRRKR